MQSSTPDSSASTRGDASERGYAGSGDLIPPHGGHLTKLVPDVKRHEEIHGASRNWLSWNLTPRQMCDLELLLNGGFSPLRGFMDRAEYESVCGSMRLTDGTLWPIPMTLDVPEELARKSNPGTALALRDPVGVLLAALHV